METILEVTCTFLYSRADIRAQSTAHVRKYELTVYLPY